MNYNYSITKNNYLKLRLLYGAGGDEDKNETISQTVDKNITSENKNDENKVTLYLSLIHI